MAWCMAFWACFICSVVPEPVTSFWGGCYIKWILIFWVCFYCGTLQWQPTTDRQTQMLICFLTNRKIENWQIYGQAYISMLWLFWWKPYPSAEKWHGCHSKNVKTLIVSFSMNVLKVQILIFRFGGINIITDGYSFNVFSLTVQVSAHGVIHKCHRPVTCNLSYFLMKLNSLIFTITWLIFRFRFKYVLFQSKLIYYYEI